MKSHWNKVLCQIVSQGWIKAHQRSRIGALADFETVCERKLAAKQYISDIWSSAPEKKWLNSAKVTLRFSTLLKLTACFTLTTSSNCSAGEREKEEGGKKKRKNRLPAGEKCELSYPKSNFLESGGPWIKSSRGDAAVELCKKTFYSAQTLRWTKVEASLFGAFCFGEILSGARGAEPECG